MSEVLRFPLVTDRARRLWAIQAPEPLDTLLQVAESLKKL